MKQVISASRRTDIPAFYLPWFMDHIRRGFIDVPNPFNRSQVQRVSLSPRDVAWIVFWSRNYGVFLKHQDFFSHYRLFFHFTINPVNRVLEPDMIPPDDAFRQMEQLVKRYGAESIIWRYDPIVFYQRAGAVYSNHNIRIFREMVSRVSAMGITRCYTSIAHIYSKIIKRSRKISDFRFVEIADDEKYLILQEMVDIASLYGVQIHSCSNDRLLKVKGMKKGHCIDGRLLNRLGHEPVTEKPHPTRPDCGCTYSIDIGDYVETHCKYHCLYCYARR